MYIEQTNSTNTLMREMLARGRWPEGDTCLRAGFQTAGRGQQGNGWESAPDENLLCSILVEREKTVALKEENLFDINVLAAVGLHRAIHRATTSHSPDNYETLSRENPLGGVPLTVKWPNDLYSGDRKLAGILVETAVIGHEVKYAIIGIGLNVNQTEFRSDAPNPVSLRQITGETYDLDLLMNQLLASIREVQAWPRNEWWAYYRAHLYRREGWYPFVEREVSTAPTMNADTAAEGQFLARIEDILPTGEMVLLDQKGKERKYHFKQIRYVV